MIEGTTVTVRPHPARNLWEARLTHAGQRKSFYGSSSDLALTKAKAYLQSLKGLEQVALDAQAKASFGVFVATELGPIYAAKRNRNTREQGAWGLRVVIQHFGHLSIPTLTVGQVVTQWGQVCKAYPEPGTQRTILKFLGRTCRMLTRSGQIPYDYSIEIERPELTKRISVPTPEQAVKFLRAISGDRLEPKVFIELLLGLRDEEANALELVDLQGNELHVPGTKTGNAPRTIYLPTPLADALREYGKGKRQFFIETASVKGKKGQNRYASNSSRDLKVLAARHGLPYWSNHAYRHCMATGLELLGCPPTVRLAILGQSTKGVVQHLYVHPTPEAQREWLAKWADRLGVLKTKCLPGVPQTERGTDLRGNHLKLSNL